MYSKLRMRLAISRHLGKDEAIHSEYSIKSVEYFVGKRTGTIRKAFEVIYPRDIYPDFVLITSNLLWHQQRVTFAF